MASQRNAKIVTTIEGSEGGEVQVATSNAESEGEANIVTFIPATETNITNPRNEWEDRRGEGLETPAQRNSLVL